MTLLLVLAVALVVILLGVYLAERHEQQQRNERQTHYQNHLNQIAETTRTRMRQASDSYLHNLNKITRR